MSVPRIIPVLLLKNKGLVKTVKFQDPKYIGDPINAVKIFNEKEVDELIFLDITASGEKRKPNFEYLGKIASECFMPLCYGGGINSLEDIGKIINLGVEKVSVNSFAYSNPSFIKEAANEFGSSTIVVSVDVKKNLWGKYVVALNNGKTITKTDPLEYVRIIEDMEAGEILLNSVDRDGVMNGYDLELIAKISSAVNIPVVACGGAKNTDDFKSALNSGASALAAGSMFVFHGKLKAVLISYPSQDHLKSVFK
jgi:imidazole glycerol-phosphate synthase subunit HisF